MARKAVAITAFAVHIDQGLAEAEDGTFHQRTPSNGFVFFKGAAGQRPIEIKAGFGRSVSLALHSNPLSIGRGDMFCFIGR
ncbi:hypothetical protein GCM10007898_43940 [Dyella flagellata]|uniref:Uncharacterized protein n=1 Tax=Dyella flagellata TaxID=1867833 RepID=A0ABQ5XID6_9GAMM|nr:hypothetical protein GCM10007898_43940 [Dyella flagellata]